jgi:hypothetical protein
MTDITVPPEGAPARFERALGTSSAQGGRASGPHSATSGLTFQERCALRNVLFRDWRPHLSSDERDLLSYIYDHTFEWGRTTLDATWGQMSEGVRSEGGRWRLAPIGMSRRNYFRTIALLKKRGTLIVESEQRKCTKIRINLTWTPAEGVPSPRLIIAKLRVPQRLQGSFVPDRHQDGLDWGSETGVNQAPDWCQTGTPYKQYLQQTKNQGSPALPASPRPALPKGPRPPVKEKAECVSAGGSLTVQQALATVKAESAEKRVEALAKAREKSSADALQITWNAAWTETYPMPPAMWSGQDKHMIRAVVNSRFLQDPATQHAFVDFVVRNWEVIVATRFKWMKDPAPSTPSVRFLCAKKLTGHFIDAYLERERIEEARLDQSEEGEIKRLMIQGMNREDALKQLGERRAMSRQRAESQDSATLRQQIEAERAKTTEARKQVLTERAKARAAQTEAEPKPAAEPFDELPPFSLELIELPPLDLSRFN